MSQLEVDKIIPQSGTTLTIGDSGDTISFAEGTNLGIDTNTLVIDSTNNRVGIKNASPTVELDVTGSVAVSGTVTATSFSGDGSSLTGISSVGGATGVDFNDNVKARFGTGNDLEIYHDGSHSFIKDGGTGDLRILATDFRVKDATDSEFLITGTVNAGVALYHDNSIKLQTTSTGADVRTTTSGAESKLRVSSNNVTGDNDATVVISNSGSGDAMLRFDYEESNTDRARIGTSSSSQALRFYTAGNNERMQIDSSGNVGIGTSSPDGSSFSGSSSPVLDVSGTRPLIILSETDSNTKKAWLGLSSDQFFVGGTNTDTVFYTDNAERMRIKSDGKLMINTTSDLGNSQGVLHVKGKTSNNIARFGAGSNGEEVIFVNQDDTQVGSIMINSSSTSYNTSSDYRLKENVIDLDDATTRVKQLQPKRFNFISEPDTTIDGFLAHEVSSIVPEAIIGTYNEVEVWKENEELPEGVSVGDNKLDDEGNTIPKYQGIDQSKLVPLLTASLQEAITKIEELETRLTALET